MSPLTSPPDRPPAAAPRSPADLRGWIVAAVARALKVEPATVDTAAPLDTLGVDSLGALGLTGALAEWLDRDLPATLMWDYPSIDAMAEGLADVASPVVPPGVVDLQPLGHRRPLFVFPGLGGHPVTFAPLAAALGTDQPCRGLTVPGLDGDAGPLPTVEAIAEAMVANLRRAQPTGPYQLAGYSFGGLLAYEAARQLTAAGERVSLLAIYDAFTAAGRTPRPAWQRLALHAYRLATRPGRLRYLRDRLRHLKPADGDSDGTDSAAPSDGREAAAVGAVNAANRHAAAVCRPAPYAGSLILFRPTVRPDHNAFYRTDPAGGWTAVAAGGVRVIDLPGTHLTLLAAEHAPAAAAALRPFLSDAA
jgi:thioesterase domain-containing protein/acyl carrier protein